MPSGMTSDEMVRLAVDAAPPLTDAQRAVIAAKLRPAERQPVMQVQQEPIERKAA